MSKADKIKKTIYIDEDVEKLIKIKAVTEETTESEQYNSFLRKALKNEVVNETFSLKDK